MGISSQLNADPKVIVGNNPDSKVIKLGIRNKLPTYCINDKNFPREYNSPDKAILEKMIKHDVNLIILAGYMKKLGDLILESYPNRILNIHPSLLPKYGGQGMYGRKVHEAVIASNDKLSGATIHLVNKEYDCGKIIAQCTVPIYIKDNADSLERRILNFEHILYSQALIDIGKGIINLDDI